MAEPVSDSTPVAAFQLPVMPFALVNANTSSPLTKPPVISTVAPSIFVSSESLSVNAASMTAAAPDSV